ncbi:MAG: ABC transporter permease [Kofleriaceae bacterium]
MKAMFTIFRREFAAYTRSVMGWVVASVAMLAMGIVFQAFSSKSNLASEMMSQFFWGASGVVMIISVILSFRVIAEERQAGSIMLLSTSPVREWSIVVGKFLGALGFLTVILALSVYIPLLIKGQGKITGIQIFVGYLGLWLLGAACLAIGVFASSLTREMVIAAVVAAIVVGSLVLLFQLSKVLDPPLRMVVAELDLWWIHFQQGFMRGVFNLKDLIYYLAVVYFFLLLAVKTMEAKRWQ